MVINLLKVRFLQIYREFSSIGLLRILFIVCAIAPLLLIFIYQKLKVSPYGYIIAGVFLLLILSIHRKRKDYFFLYKLSGNPSPVYFIEYCVFSLPLAILFVITKQFLPLLPFYLLMFTFSFLKPTVSTYYTFNGIVQFVPNGLFEWQSGLRKNLVVLFPSYLLGLFGVINFWFFVVSIFLITVVFVSFYSEYEPIKMLEAKEHGAARFLKDKITRHLLYFSLLILPIVLISLVHLNFWIYTLISFVLSINLILFGILLKYSYYYPNSISSSHQFITAIVCLISLILPISAIVLLLNIFYYGKAINNLKNYLHAYD